MERARANAAASSSENVAFEQGDLSDLRISGLFDAVVGRLILIHLDDPAAVVKELTRLVRPRWRHHLPGLQHLQDARRPSRTPGGGETVEWIAAARSGKAAATLTWVSNWPMYYGRSGLPEPRVAVAVPTGGPDSAAVTLIAESALQSAAGDGARRNHHRPEAGLDTLRARMSRACAEVQATVYVPELVAAWAVLR
ncbi:methyltransferase domain-containing protein [Streptomyces sp. L7]